MMQETIPVSQENPLYTSVIDLYKKQITALTGQVSADELKIAFIKRGIDLSPDVLQSTKRNDVMQAGIREIADNASTKESDVGLRTTRCMSELERVIKSTNKNAWATAFEEKTFGEFAPLGNEELGKVMGDLDTAFSVEEQRTLAFEVGLDYEDLVPTGGGKVGASLLSKMIRLGKIKELQEAIFNARPHLRPIETVYVATGKPTSTEQKPASVASTPVAPEIDDPLAAALLKKNSTVEEIKQLAAELGVSSNPDLTTDSSALEYAQDLLTAVELRAYYGDIAAAQKFYDLTGITVIDLRTMKPLVLKTKPQPQPDNTANEPARIDISSDSLSRKERDQLNLLVWNHLKTIVNVGELEILGTGFGIDYENLKGSTFSNKINYLVQTMYRRGRIDELSNAVMVFVPGFPNVNEMVKGVDSVKEFQAAFIDVKSQWFAALEQVPHDQRSGKLTQFANTYADKLSHVTAPNDHLKRLYSAREVSVKNPSPGTPRNAVEREIIDLAVRQSATDPLTAKLFFEALEDSHLMTTNLRQQFNRLKTNYPHYFAQS